MEGFSIMKNLFVIAAALILFSFFNLEIKSQMVDGWLKTGSKPESYEIGKSSVQFENLPTYYLKSIVNVDNGFGTLSKVLSASDYTGKRVRLSGYIKSENVDNHAGMWMRVDGSEPGNTLAFDNMYNRPIKGTNDWTKYDIVLDFSDKSSLITYGVLLSGNGQLWISNLSFEVVGKDVPTTN